MLPRTAQTNKFIWDRVTDIIRGWRSVLYCGSAMVTWLSFRCILNAVISQESRHTKDIHKYVDVCDE